MKKYKAVFISGSTDYVYSKEQQAEIAVLTDLYPRVLDAKTFRDEDLSEVEVIFSSWGMPCLDEDDFKRMPRLKVVFYAAGATDAFARPLFAHGVLLCSAWRANAIPVAEFAAAQIVLSMKNYFSPLMRVRSAKDWSFEHLGPGCYGETVALLGAGAISSRVRELLEPYRLNVIVVPSHPERRTVSLEEAFRTAYVISNHFPNREDNRKTLTREMFASMRKGATFINTGRGAQVDEAGLAEVLATRPDLTALLDVTWPEPPEEDSPLYRLPNVILTPHIAGSANDEVHRMADWMIEDFKRFAAGLPVENQVTEKQLLSYTPSRANS